MLLINLLLLLIPILTAFHGKCTQWLIEWEYVHRSFTKQYQMTPMKNEKNNMKTLSRNYLTNIYLLSII